MKLYQIEDIPTENCNLYPELEVFVQGDETGPNPGNEALCKNILAHLEEYHEKARRYLSSYYMALDMGAAFWTLCAAEFGEVTFIDGTAVSGFSLLYLYSPPNEEVYNCFQIKVKFKENGWPMGFECGPEF